MEVAVAERAADSQQYMYRTRCVCVTKRLHHISCALLQQYR
jgi:hypothetical protein